MPASPRRLALQDHGQHLLAHADELGVGLHRARVARLDEAAAEVELVRVRDAPGRGVITISSVARNSASSTLCVMKKNILPVRCQTLEDQLLDLLARERVERAERLVHQHHFGVARERAREADALLHAAGELVDRARRRSSRGRRGAACRARSRARSALRHAAHAQAELDVVDDVEPRHQRVLLEHDAALGARAGHRLAVEHDRRLRTAAGSRRCTTAASSCRSRTRRARRRSRRRASRG